MSLLESDQSLEGTGTFLKSSSFNYEKKLAGLEEINSSVVRTPMEGTTGKDPWATTRIQENLLIGSQSDNRNLSSTTTTN